MEGHEPLTTEILEIDALQSHIQNTLDIIRPEIEAFLQNPELPEWVPPSTDPRVCEFFRNLRIPAYQDGSPSLLFHNLRFSDDEVVNGIFEQSQNILVCNTSGSGKTRRILEGLTKYWGFYFVAARDNNNVGIGDLEDTLKAIGSCVDWTNDLRSFKAQEQSQRNRYNGFISRGAIQKVLAARMVVFKLFLRLAEARDGSILPEHKRLWLLFQLCNPLPGFETPHPFITMMESLDCASDRALTTLINDFDCTHEQYFPNSKFIIALDEAQVVGRQSKYRFSFLLSRNTSVFQPILREIVKVFSAIVGQIVVAGTELSLEDMEDSLCTGVGKPLYRFKSFIELGMFDDPQKLEATLRQYIPPFLLESDSGRSLQLRIREYLPGRYRFLIHFLELLLRNGLKSPHTLLNEYLAQYFFSPPGDMSYATPFTSQEPPLNVKPRVRMFDWERLRKDSSDIHEIALIIHSHLIKGSTPTFGSLAHKHVEYGIARLRIDHRCEIIEPLAFLSVVRWFETQKNLCLEATLREKLTDEECRGYRFEGLVILFLLRMFCCPTVLDSVFKFHGTVPAWADAKTHIIGDGAVPVNILEFPRRYSSPGVVQYAKEIQDIIRWLKESPASSVLVPTNLFGPDVIIKCADGLLLMGQDMSCLTGNKNELDDATTTAKAINSLNPTKWFVKEKPQRRQMLIDAFQEFTILRFLVGYPNLDLKASSVREALSDLGQVPFATITLDAFRARFVLPGEVRNVLQPMEHAFACKRGLDMMD